MSNGQLVSLLFVDHLDAVASGKEFELLHRNGLFSAEVPPDEVFKLALHELEATALNQIFEVHDVDLLGVFVLNAVKESLQELVVLLLVGEFVRATSIEGAH